MLLTPSMLFASASLDATTVALRPSSIVALKVCIRVSSDCSFHSLISMVVTSKPTLHCPSAALVVMRTEPGTSHDISLWRMKGAGVAPSSCVCFGRTLAKIREPMLAP